MDQKGGGVEHGLQQLSECALGAVRGGGADSA